MSGKYTRGLYDLYKPLWPKILNRLEPVRQFRTDRSTPCCYLFYLEFRFGQLSLDYKTWQRVQLEFWLVWYSTNSYTIQLNKYVVRIIKSQYIILRMTYMDFAARKTFHCIDLEGHVSWWSLKVMTGNNL